VADKRDIKVITDKKQRVELTVKGLMSILEGIEF
jgi:hypothetical protein